MQMNNPAQVSPLARMGFTGAITLLLVLSLLSLPHPCFSQTAAATPSRPALYDFGSGMCLSCQEMEKILADLKGRYGERLEVRLIYVDKDKDLTRQYGIMLIPTQVFLDASGKEVDRHVGLFPRDDLIKKLKELKFIPD
jgi:thioredoxin 1